MEKRTVGAMMRIYCRAHHGAEGLCAECGDLQAYAHARLDACRFGKRKPTCQKCPTHCYRHFMRTRMQEVMRFAGPRMLLRHPLFALAHWLREIFSRVPKPPYPPHARA